MGILVLLLILPQSLYVFGDYMAVGVRFPLVRWQESVYGTSIIPVNREVVYLTSGVLRWTDPSTGKINPAAAATIVWLVGLASLFAAAALIISWHYLGNPGHARFAGPLLIITGVLFLLWAIVQFGPLLSGPSGYSIPVGVPILWYCGYQFMQAAKGAGGQEPAEQPAES